LICHEIVVDLIVLLFKLWIYPWTHWKTNSTQICIYLESFKKGQRHWDNKSFHRVFVNYFIYARKLYRIFSCSSLTEGIIVVCHYQNGLVIPEFKLYHLSITWLRSSYWSSCHSRGPPGDLYVYLDVLEIPGIQRDDINLRSTISISYLEAILGSVVQVD
jgi:hypothetical protein